ncbi:MAG TPA: AAA family ATPase [Mycobacterium sp.]|nr:AAA family ATPase [Mycobacterium sp.]
MRLHRLVLSNYRGIAHRDIEFPERGVTVVSGPNEVGKSSMIEALDLLLESKDRSSKKDVKQVKPTHADVGSEVTAEISTGPYRFVYRKRFHKKHETELTILSPRREQLTGDEAHDRVRAMLEQTVDTGLWQAQRVLQSASTSAVDLSACDALSRALDVAASDSAGCDLASGLSSTEPLLIEKIDAEYARYFTTAAGRPTGEWAAVTAALKKADDEVAQCVAALAEVDDRVARHSGLSAERAVLSGQRAEAIERRSAAERAAGALDVLADEHRAAQAHAKAAGAEHLAADAAHRERLRLRAEVAERNSALSDLETAAAQAVDAEVLGRETLTEAELLVEKAATALIQLRDRVTAARAALERSAEAAEALRLSERLARIDDTQKELDVVAARLREIVLTDRAFHAIEAAAKAVDIARAQAELSAPTVQLTAEAEIEVEIGERSLTLSAGDTFDLSLTETTTIRLPGFLSTTVKPDAAAVESHSKLVGAQSHLKELLIGSGAGDLDEARRLDQARRELLAQRDQLTERLAGAKGSEDPAALRSRLTELREMHAGTDESGDPAQLQAELDTARAACVTAETAHTNQQKVVELAATRVSERVTAAAVLRAKVATARTELAGVEERLDRLRGEAPDDDLAVLAEQTAGRATAAAAELAELTAQLAEAGIDAVTAELAAARAVATDLDQRHCAVDQAVRNETVALDVMGSEGRAGKLDAARIRREHAVAEYARVQSRAEAARLLRDVMGRHRDDTRQRYVQPFRAEVERLGRTVFGPTFEVEVDSDLQIRNRTLNGTTVPFESLSGGAKEQLGIVARLAVAALVATEDAVPVMIDDALGFTDPDRLAKMGAVFDAVGADGQVIVLTCSAERYTAVAGAHRVELTA